MAIQKVQPELVDSTKDFTFANVTATSGVSTGNITGNGTVDFTSASNVSLGSNSNLHISGGSSGQYLQTNGSGDLTWATIATASTSNGTSNLSIPIVDGNINLSVGGNANILVVTGSSANITGNLNVTENSILGNLASANYISGNGSLLSSITGGNVVGNVANANYATYSGTAYSVSGSNVSGDVSGANHANIADSANAVAGSNVTGQVSNALIAGTVYTNAQPNITSVGTLSNLSVTGDATIGGNLTVNGTLTSINSTIVEIDDLAIVLANDATSSSMANGAGIIINGASATILYENTPNAFVFSHPISANGSLLTHLPGANVTGIVANANYAAYAGNAYSVTGSNVSGDVAGANHANIADSANAVAGSNVTGQVSNALIAGTVYTNAQPNITSVGTLSSLTVGPNSSITMSGTTGYVQANSIYGRDGTSAIYPYYNSVSGSAGIRTELTVGTSGTGNLTVNGKTNIIGNLTSENANLGNLVTANFFKGDGSLLTSLTGGNVSGVVANANYATYSGTAYSITGSNVSGDVSGANHANVADTANLVYGANVSGDVSGANHANIADSANSIAGANVTGQVGNALVSGTVYTNAQPNITSVGTLSNLSVTGNVTAGNVKSDHLLYANGDPYSFVSNAAGSNTQIQFNNNNSFTGSANLTFDSSTNTLTTVNIESTVANTGNLNVVNYVTGNLIPNANVTYNLGSSTNRWKDLYLSGNTINLGTSSVSADANGAIVVPNLVSNTNITAGSLTVSNIDSTSTVTAIAFQATTATSAPFIVSSTVQVANLNVEFAGSATTAGTVTTNAQPNITSVGTLASLSVTGNVTAGNVKSDHLLYANGDPYVFTTNASGSNTYVQFNDSNLFAGSANFTFDKSTNTLSVTNIIANGSQLTHLTGGNVVGDVSGANHANIADSANAVAGANVTGQVSNALIAGTVYTNAQPNITSVGTLNGLTSTGTINLTGASNVSLGSVSNVHVSGGSSGQMLTTDGSGGLSWTTISTSSISNGTSNVSIPSSGGNVNLSVSGNANILVVTGTGANINGTLYSSGNANVGNLTTARIDATDVIATGNVSAGNLVVTGTIAYADVTSFKVKDPVIEQGGYPNGDPLTSNDGLDRGQILHYYSSGQVDAFMGWKNTAGEFIVASNVTVNPYNVVTVNQYGNLRADRFIGNGSSLSSITGSNVSGDVSGANHANIADSANAVAGANVTGQVGNALISGTVYTNAQPNITSVGTLTSLSVTGNISSGNADLGNLATSNFFSGNGSLLSHLVGANVSGDVSGANHANVADSANSVAGANVSGDVSGANHANVADSANSVAGANVTGQVSNALVAGTVYTNAQPNITSVGTLNSLSVTGNISAGNVKSDHLLYANGDPYSFTTNASGSNTYVQFNDSNLFAGSANFTFNKTTNTLSVTNIIADGSGLTNINGGNVTSQVANALIASTVYTNSQPNITSLGTLTSLSVSGNITSGNASLGNLATSNYFSGNGSLLSSITGANVSGDVSGANHANIADSANAVAGANVTGQVSNALIAGTVYTNAQPNITSVGTLISLSISGNITSGNANLGNLASANFFTGNGALLSHITGSNVSGDVSGANHANVADSANAVAGANVTGQVSNALISGTVYTNAQPNITSVGTLVSLAITGNITSGNANLGNLASANYFSGNGSLLSSITGANISGDVAGANHANIADLANAVAGANVTGQVSNALVAGTVYTNAQPNITSVGELTSLTITGNVTSGNANLGNVVIANYFSGNGSLLSSITGANVTGTVSSASTAGTVTANAQPNITSVGTLTTVTISGNLSSGNANLGNLATSNYFSGDGHLLTNITGGNVVGAVGSATTATTAGTVTTNAQPNITSVGTLTDTTIAGNLTVSGTTLYANVVTLNIKDPVIELGGNPNGDALSSDDGKDRGTLLHYYSGGVKDAFMGWDNSNAEFAFGSNVTKTSEVMTFNTFGNVRAGYFLGNGSQLTGVIATIASTVTTNAQPNITSVGTLSSLTITGNITSGNANLGNLASANYFSGDGSLLTNITGGNVSGQVSNALIASTVYTNAQPNITSLGTLSGLTGTGTFNLTGASNIALGPVGNVHITGGTSGQYLQTDGSGTLSWVSPSAGTSIINGTSNISIPSSGGNVTIGVAGNAAIVTVTGTGVNVSGTLNTGSGIITTTGNITSGNANLGNLGYANYLGGTLTTATQPNITSVGSLSSLTITGNLTSGNANLGNLASANYFSGDGSLLTNITGGNVTGQVGNSLIAGTVYTNAQPNITSVGTLTSLTVTGNVSSGNANLGNLATSNYFSGNGSLLSSIAGANVTGQVSNALVAGTVYTNAQPNITSIGTLSGLTVSGDTTLTGNLTVTGTTITVSSNNVAYTDSLIELHTYANLAPLTSDDGKDIGIHVHYYKSSDKHAFFGVSNDTLALEYYVDGTETSGVFSGTYGNFKGSQYISTVSTGTAPFVVTSTTQVANLNVATAGSATTAGTVTSSSQPNITSVGTLSSVTVTGNVSSGNANLGNLATSNYFSGNGSLLTSITGANVSGQVGNALVAGTVYTAAQPNITSVSTSFSGLTLAANGNIALSGSASQISGANLVSASYLTGTLTTASQPNITSTGTLASLTVTANISSGNANLGNLVTANFFTGNGSLLTSITGGNVSGQVGNALVAGTVYTAAQPNITSVGTLVSTTLAANANITLSGSESQVTGANLVSASYLTGTLTTAAQPNITSTGTLTSTTLAANANITLSGSASQVTGANLVSASYVTGTLTTAAQPNITSTGTLAGLTGTGTINLTGASNVALGAVGNIHITGGSSGYVLTTDGSGGLSWASTGSLSVSTSTISNGSSNVNIPTSNGNVVVGVGGTAAVVTVSTNAVVLAANANVTLSGSASQITGANLVSASYVSGNGSLLTSITGGNVTGQVGNALIAGTVYTNAQPNITSVGTLATTTLAANANLALSGSASQISGANLVSASYLTGTLTTGAQPNITSTGTLTDLVVSGNLTVGGTTAYINVTTTAIKDPIIEVGGGANGAALGSNDSKDRGTLLHYYTTGVVDAFMGWDNSNSEFAFGSNVSVASEVVTFNTFGNLRAGYFIGNGSTLTSLAGANVTGQVGNALVAGTVYTGAQPNITSVGTLATTTLAANANLALSGSASQISGANLVSASYVTGTLTTAAQPNITSVGTLTTLSSGTLTLNANSNIVLSGSASQVSGANLVSASYLTGTLTTAAQPNITSVGTLATTTLAANANLALSGSASQISGANLVSASYVTGTLTTAAQPNITSTGTLAGITATGTLNFTGASNVALGAVGNVHITGGSSGQYLQTDGSGTLSWQTITVSSASISNGTSNVSIPASNGNIVFGSNGTAAVVTVSSNAVTLVANGNITLSGSASQVSGANLISGTYLTGTLTTAAQPNITSVGTLASTTIAANANITLSGSASQVSGANLVSASYLTGTLTTAAQPNITSVGTLVNTTLGSTNSLSGGNLVSASYLTGTLTTAAQPNITSVGTLTTLSSGTLTLNANANIVMSGSASQLSGANLVSASYLTGTLTTAAQPNITSVGTLVNTTLGSTNSLSGGNLVSATYLTGTLTTGAQPNITSHGTLTSLTVSGTSNLGAVGNVTITGGTSGQYLQTNGSGTLSWQTVNAPTFAKMFVLVR